MSYISNVTVIYVVIISKVVISKVVISIVEMSFASEKKYRPFFIFRFNFFFFKIFYKIFAQLTFANSKNFEFSTETKI